MNFLLAATAALALATLISTAAQAQLNRNYSLSAPTSNPLQEQMREDYASQLRATQRQQLQQNPSGQTRQEMAVGHELNPYTGPR